jgi:hypothetical protein
MSLSRWECRRQSTGIWYPARQRDPLDEDAIRIFGVGNDPSGVAYFFYEDWGNPSGWNAQKTEAARVYVQENILDRRTLVSELPNDSPYKDADPGLNTVFWQLWTPPNGVEDLYLVERSSYMEMLDYDRDRGLMFAVRVEWDEPL